MVKKELFYTSVMYYILEHIVFTPIPYYMGVHGCVQVCIHMSTKKMKLRMKSYFNNNQNLKFNEKSQLKMKPMVPNKIGLKKFFKIKLGS